MDTRAADEVAQHLVEIKQFMPETYRHIQLKAKEEGSGVFALVRRGLRGEANCFYAMERGWVKGTPFSSETAMPEAIAKYMVEFGVSFVCCLKVVEKEGATHGTH